MNRRLLLTPVVLATMLTPAVALATPAEAANRTPGCMTGTEYGRLKANMTPASVKSVVGNWGRLDLTVSEDVDVIYPGDGNGDYVYDADLDVFELVGDLNGDWTQVTDETTGETTFELVGATYTRETWVDQVRTYRKCRSFDRGRSRAAVNFDDYTQAGSGLRLYRKYRNNPLARTGRVALLAGKDAGAVVAEQPAGGATRVPVG